VRSAVLTWTASPHSPRTIRLMIATGSLQLDRTIVTALADDRLTPRTSGAMPSEVPAITTTTTHTRPLVLTVGHPGVGPQVDTDMEARQPAPGILDLGLEAVGAPREEPPVRDLTATMLT